MNNFSSCLYLQIDADLVANVVNIDSLSYYLPQPRDRLVAVYTAQMVTKEAKQSSKNESERQIKKLLENLHSKINDLQAARKRNREPVENDTGQRAKLRKKAKYSDYNESKTTLQVQFSWLMYNERRKKYSQVRVRQGGGTRTIQMNKEWTKADILKYGKSIFFDEGKSLMGKLEDFDFDILDNKQRPFPDRATVSELVKTLRQSGMLTMHCYMATKRRRNPPVVVTMPRTFQIISKSALPRNPSSQQQSATEKDNSNLPPGESNLLTETSNCSEDSVALQPPTGAITKASALNDTPSLEILNRPKTPILASHLNTDNMKTCSPLPAKNTSQSQYSNFILSPADFEKIRFNASDMIGKGACGIVYKGTYYNGDVAIKEIKVKKNRRVKNHLLNEICREVSTNATVRHSNIVQLLAYAFGKNSVYLVSEFINGHNLEDILFDADCVFELPYEKKFSVAKNIAAALSFMHPQNIIHQDIKPANVLVERSSYVAKVCDFGLCRIRQAHAISFSAALGIVGTPSYMAPECLLQSKKGRAESDIWSMGCTFVELFSERTVWNGEDDSDTLEYIRKNMQHRKMPDGLALLEGHARTVATGCLHYDMAKRLTAEQVCELLNKMVRQVY